MPAVIVLNTKSQQSKPFLKRISTNLVLDTAHVKNILILDDKICIGLGAPLM